MGFRSGNYASIWEITPVSATCTKARISTSRKNKEGNYETDFSGFVSFVGTLAATQALKLREKDRIKLGDVDVSNRYDKEKKITYTNFTVFNFEMANGGGSSSPQQKTQNVLQGDPDFLKVDDIEGEEGTPW